MRTQAKRMYISFVLQAYSTCVEIVVSTKQLT